MIDTEATRKRLAAAQTLLLEPTTTREKFTSIRSMIRGINPTIDAALGRIDQQFSTWDKIESGDAIGLSAEHLPENTEEEKKRKRALLLFINSWRKLESEVKRVQAELAAAENAPSSGDKASHWSRIFNFAKGPFGIITIIAAGVVVAMQATAVTITLENKGCTTMHPSSSIPISIPGLKLPTEPLVSGGSAEVVIPGLTVNVENPRRGVLELRVLTYALTFQLPGNIRDVTLNGESLLGKSTQIRLSERDQHTLVLSCS